MAKAFRWKGPGVLTIRPQAGECIVVPPSGKESIVRDGVILEYLGRAKVDAWVKAGTAEYVNVLEGAFHVVAAATPLDEQTLVSAQTELSQHAKDIEVIRNTRTAEPARGTQGGTLPPETARATGLSDGRENRSEPISDSDLERLTAPGAGPGGEQ